ncbi:MAG: TrpR-like protein YerC/YecD [Tissierellia bacterium]|nr:TrpR-like protein YerC/YecD [Tissierellia bacterium]
MVEEYNSQIKDEQIDRLFEAILKLKTTEECYRFFEDICTVKEIQSIAQRLEVASLLVKDKTYNEIEKDTGVSTATISRINRALNYGAGGYKIVLERLGHFKDQE